ncbi:element excision factor XisH family protein [Nostoc sp. CENA543]|uniref:element excision factor XisH family protein n=1 Tax=Nostoc sp. CENA543 TaxID=1869241 RepID=UPI0027E55033|nr:element excision factor XisH family protein [Nostoc sp. CENA543]
MSVSAKDVVYQAVKRGLQKDRWVITHDPLVVKLGKDKVSAYRVLQLEWTIS